MRTRLILLSPAADRPLIEMHGGQRRMEQRGEGQARHRIVGPFGERSDPDRHGIPSSSRALLFYGARIEQIELTKFRKIMGGTSYPGRIQFRMEGRKAAVAAECMQTHSPVPPPVHRGL